MNVFYYLLEANAYLLVLYSFFRLALIRDTFYSFNRFYLLAAPIFAFIMPAISISGLRPQEAVYYTVGPFVEATMEWTKADMLLTLYTVIAAGFLMRLSLRLFQVWRMVRNGQANVLNGMKIVPITDRTQSFSFMRYLFIHPEAENADVIIRHERVHIKQLHSIDILFFELLQIINWFNPFIRMMEKDLKALHEFIADEEASRYEKDPGEYALFLIQNSYGILPNTLGNSMFNQSLLKSRIMKLNQEKSPQRARIKYLLVLLILPFMLCITAMAFDKPYGIIDLMPRTKAIAQDTIKKRLLPPPPQPPKAPAKTAKIAPPPTPRVLKKATVAPPPPPAPPKVLEKTIAPPPPPAPPKTGALPKPPKPVIDPVPSKTGALPAPPRPAVAPAPSKKSIAPNPTTEPAVGKVAQPAAKENLAPPEAKWQVTRKFSRWNNYGDVRSAPTSEKQGNNGPKQQWHVTWTVSKPGLRFAPTSEKRGDQEIRDILIETPAPTEKSKTLPEPKPQSPSGMKKEKSTPAGPAPMLLS